MTRKERIRWIDVLKGILLILICIGHLGDLPWWISPLISPTSMFYVPMFFVLSGYLLSVEGRDFKSFVKRKIETLLVPYIFFSVFFFVLDWNTWLHPIMDTLHNLHRFLIEGTGCAKASPLWFVMALFGGEILCRAILCRVHGVKTLLSIIILLSLCAFALSVNEMHLPWQGHLLPSVGVFMLGGYIFRKLKEGVWVNIPEYIIAILLLSGGVMIAYMIPLGDMHFNHICQYPLFFIAPLAVSWACFKLFGQYTHFFHSYMAKPFVWIAQNGIVILACHIYLVICFDAVWTKMGINNTDLHFMLKCVFVCIVLFFVLVPFFDRYFSYCIGRRKRA